MSTTEKASEAALARVLVAWLKANDWEANEEVPFRADAPGASTWIADVVATKGGIVAVFEVKKAMGLDVMDQADRWLNHANQSWVVVPGDGRAASPGHAYGYRRLNDAGIGVLHIRKHTKLEEQMALRPGGTLPAPEALVSVVHQAEHFDVNTAPLREALRPEHRDGSFAGAGTKTGERANKTNLVYKQIREYLKARGNDAPLEEIVRNYKAPWLILKAKEGQIPMVRLNGSGPAVLLELVEPGNETPILSDRSSRTARRDRRVYG